MQVSDSMIFPERFLILASPPPWEGDARMAFRVMAAIVCSFRAEWGPARKLTANMIWERVPGKPYLQSGLLARPQRLLSWLTGAEFINYPRKRPQTFSCNCMYPHSVVVWKCILNMYCLEQSRQGSVWITDTGICKV